ncbi:uncharacterized protein LOC123546838 [Mercenaria mercenaria]|uniref:uncharacterized protein LOC123546838 n=1 Tax=Mercenaria mercenaria TaxID=6596 RepID=UPI00234E3996|nr:uncharacterized protein LOC123546838 [Mercenaria mercenaria]
MEEEMEAGSSEGGIFVNDLEINHTDSVEEDMEVDNLMAGIQNLFCESGPAKGQEVNKNMTETDTEFLYGFSDDLFKKTEEPTNDRQTNVKSADNKSDISKVKYDSDSDSDIKFNLFDDTDVEDDAAYLFSDIKPLPGSRSSKFSKNERSRDTETKPKVDKQGKMFPQSSSVNQVNRGLMGLSLSNSDSNLIKDSKAEYTGPKPEDDNFCSICRDAHTNPKTLKKCSHSFCTDCIDEYFKIKPACPECFVAYGVIKGNQPEGYMGDSISKIKLPGYEQYNTIVVSYGFSDGTQTVICLF